MEGYTMTPSDIAAVNRGGYGDGFGFGNGSGMWFLALLALTGGFGFGGRGNAVTEADLCNANSFNDLKSSVRDISGQISSMNVGLTKGLCDFGYTTLAQFNNLERQLADCCCTTQRAVDSVKFDMANYAAATNATITSAMQKVLDQLNADKAAAQAARIQQLELNQALCGVVRYPTMTTYATNCNPFFGYSGCGCNNI